MSSWYSSWFSSLPSFDFSLPFSIQSRFIAFILQKSLGRFLKPGQLDTYQIDSQIGSGYINVKDLELDSSSINALFPGLPISVHDGSISCLTARIPWPKPLTSTIGCSIQSLHVTLHVTPPTSTGLPIPSSSLTESVVSVAEAFVHDELSVREESILVESMHSKTFPDFEDDDHNIPGGLNPFMHEDSIGGEKNEVDPAGVSLFTTIIERLLARFEFDAVDTKITFVYPGHASFTLSIAEIRYHTEPPINVGPSETQPLEPTVNSPVRSVSIHGVAVTCRSLRPTSPISTPSTLSPSYSPTPFRHSPSINASPIPEPPSPISSSSSLDEDTTFLMSQSIVTLPPQRSRPSSPTSSVASSIYHSMNMTHELARTTTLTSTNPLRVDTSGLGSEPSHVFGQHCRDLDEVILSFGVEPIVVRLTTQATQASNDPDLPSPDISAPEVPKNKVIAVNALKVSITSGIIACAFRANHIRVLLDIVEICGQKSPQPSPVASDPLMPRSSQLDIEVEATIKVQGVVLLILPNSPPCCNRSSPGARPCSSNEFFSRPLAVPHLCYGYARIYLDGITGALAFIDPPVERDVQPSGSDARRVPPSTAEANAVLTVPSPAISCDLMLHDLSILGFQSCPTSDTRSNGLRAVPLLITDRGLPQQYSLSRWQSQLQELFTATSSNTDILTFDVLDWTSPQHLIDSADVSVWTTKCGLDSTPQNSTIEVTPELSNHTPALSICLRKPLLSPSKRHQSSNDPITLKMVPLHVFVDLGLMLGNRSMFKFLDELANSNVSTSTKPEDRQSVDVTEQSRAHRRTGIVVSSSPTGVHFAKQVKDSRSHKPKPRSIGEGSYSTHGSSSHDSGHQIYPPSISSGHNRKVQRSSLADQKPSLVVEIAMIRVQIRCPPPPLRPHRSGSLVVDVHSICISTLFTSTSLTGRPRRSTITSIDQDHSVTERMLDFACHGVLLAYSDAQDISATSFLLLGSPVSNEGSRSPGLHPALGVRLSKSTNKHSASASVSIDIASANVIVTKDVLDGLQKWADDVAQLIEHIAIERRTLSRPSGGPNAPRSHGESETHIHLSVSQAFVRLMLPRWGDEINLVRPFDITASNILCSVEMKTGAEVPITAVKVMDLSAFDTSGDGHRVNLLSLALSRGSPLTVRPMIETRFNSSAVPGSTAKASNIKLMLWGFTFRLLPECKWISDLGLFAKAPAGVFESVVPSERTNVSVRILESSFHIFGPHHPGAAVLYIGETTLSLVLVNKPSEMSLKLLVPSISLFLLDSLSEAVSSSGSQPMGFTVWKAAGYALISELKDLDFEFKSCQAPATAETQMLINRVNLRVHICADTLAALIGFIDDFTSAFKPPTDTTTTSTPKKAPSMVTGSRSSRNDLAYVEEHAFDRNPEVGHAPDMISDDLPSNLDYLDDSFGTAAGFREVEDGDMDDFDVEDKFTFTPSSQREGIISDIGGETIRIIKPFQVVENYYDTIPPEPIGGAYFGEATMQIRIHNCDVTLSLYDGYDWARTRELIQKEIKDMRRRLAKIKQLMATGQIQDSIDMETNTLLFNSVYIGLQTDASELEPNALIAAIDEELENDTESDIESSWQSLHPASPPRQRASSSRTQSKRTTRSDGPSIEIKLSSLDAEIDHYHPDQTLASRILTIVKDVEILDHIKTSTWRKFLCDLRSDSHGNIRETDSNMVRVELQNVHPIPSHPSQETRLRAKLLPLRLYVDQDALDFLKNFFGFQDPESPAAKKGDSDGNDVYIQHAEIFAIDIKLDYKPRRVDYRALREGKTIELMNFFHFDGAEMTLRHLDLYGINGWPRLFDKLNDLWTPDVKATQLVDVISGVAPIRSVVNVGSGVADLILLPITQYKKDGRIIRGVQKGTKAFVKSTAMEAIKLGARLATGTQVILEQAENVLGGQFNDPIHAEALQFSSVIEGLSEEDDEFPDLISKYAEQPTGLTDGVRTAYKSMHRNLNSAAQTILAVPMEVYERSGNEGAMRSVIRAVPIAVLKPMIGASEAVSKTLMGLHNTLDPNVRYETEAKYKHR